MSEQPMSEEPGAQLDEEPQDERGAPGSRDTGSDEPSGGPADRPAGRLDEGRTLRCSRSRPRCRVAGPAVRRRLTARRSHDRAQRSPETKGQPEGVDTEGTTVPPYEGRREARRRRRPGQSRAGGREGRRRDGAGRGRRDEGHRAGRHRRVARPARRRTSSRRATCPRRMSPTTGSGRRTSRVRAVPRTSPDGKGAVLVAGIGNLFLSDDGFGPEVVRRLAAQDELPAHVKIVDYGIRGMHLAYDLLDGYGALVLVDALPGDGPAGEITVLEVGAGRSRRGRVRPARHGAGRGARQRASAGRHSLPPTYVIGCQPANVDEGIGLSDAVAAADPGALEVVRALLSERMAGLTCVSASRAGSCASSTATRAARARRRARRAAPDQPRDARGATRHGRCRRLDPHPHGLRAGTDRSGGARTRRCPGCR